MDIVEIHNKALEIYLKHRDKNNEFTFYLRKKKDLKDRLNQGYWFQGSDSYMVTSPYKFADNNTKIQQISFVVSSRGKCYLEIPLLHNKNKKNYEPFFRRLVVELFNKKYLGWGKKYKKELCDENSDNIWIQELEKFLQNDVIVINKIAREENITDEELFFEEKEFNKRLDRIREIQQKPAVLKNTSEVSMSKENIPLNQILYGPPGTGKTYSTVGKALEILGADEEQKQNIKSIGKLKEVFGSRVEFVTFHQSFSYEDFVEGLKANSDDGELTYNIKNGVFKEICENAEDSGNDSLKKLKEQVEKLKEQVAEEALSLKTASGKKFTFTYQGLTVFRIIPESSERVFDGSGQFGRGYPVNIEQMIELYKNPKHKIYNLSYAKPILAYLIKENDLQKYQETTERKPHVLIIDEINRGNISRIFGELITLIEPSKRAGAEETISVKLPYSKDDFSVPNNLYIIGTMNTADRSLTLMDTALRRRFDFVEMMPNADLVKGDCDGVNLQSILKTINQRIEILYDKEHLIGHSFLMGVNTLDKLKDAFKNKILPLLEEYFYDDWQKIKAVLGDKNNEFYAEIKQDENLFVGMEVDYNQEQKIYNRQNCDDLTKEAFISIYDNNTSGNQDTSEE